MLELLLMTMADINILLFQDSVEKLIISIIVLEVWKNVEVISLAPHDINPFLHEPFILELNPVDRFDVESVVLSVMCLNDDCLAVHF